MATLADLLASVNTGNMTGQGLPQQATPFVRKPNRLADAVGAIGDVLASVGGRTPVYSTALEAEQNAYNQAMQQQRQANIFRDFATNPTNPELFGQAVAENMPAALELRNALVPKPQAQGSISDKQFRFRQLVDSGMSPREALEVAFAEQPKAPTNPLAAAGLAASGGVIFRPTAEGGIETVADFRRPAASGGGSGGGAAPASGPRPFTLEDYRAYGIDPSVPMAFDRYGQAKPVGGAASVDNAQRGGLSAADFGKVKQRLAIIPSIRQSFETARAAAEALIRAGYNGPIAGRVPDEFVPLANQFEGAIANLRSQARGLTKVAGEGSISDFETKLANAIFPSRTDTAAGIRQRLNGVSSLLDSTERSYGSLIRPSAPPPNIARNAPSARPRAVNRQTGQTVEWNGSAWVPVR